MSGGRKIPWVLIFSFILPLWLPAAGSSQLPFKRMLVLENGRQKPLDTFARNLLKQFSGRSSLSGQDASRWLARVLFTPRQTLNDRIFLINHPDVPAALNIPGQGRQRYSFAQINSGLDRLRQLAMQAAQMDDDRRSVFENEIMRLYINAHLYTELLSAFEFALNPGAGRQEAQAGDAPLLAIIPLPGAAIETWLSPAGYLAAHDRERSAADPEIALLARAAHAFAYGREDDFSLAISDFNQVIQYRLPNRAAAKKISLEVFYNRLEPFFKAQLAYGLVLIFLLLSLLVRSRHISRLCLLLLLSGFLAHSFGLLARMIIMGRPPVTNLYETFVFVSWVGVLLGIFLEWYQKNSLGIMAASVAGLLFLLIAGRYSLDGDTLGMLAAVLDSNLWLATHVVTISVGYAGCVIAGIMGHVVLIHQLSSPDDRPFRQRLSRSVYGVLAFGLIFTFIGTVMGGIWADQSWGRFWGWDPKENGALLIILWCAILLHARLAGWIGQLGMAVGSIIAIITVVLAWFGVNLLGVGLHSYGFTSGIARWLLFFVGAEVIFIAAALFQITKKRTPEKNAQA